MIRRTRYSGVPSTGVRLLTALSLAATLSACATQTVSRPGGSVAGTSPVVSVERFLQAIAQRDLDTMAQIFGTAEGPFKGDRREVELQMDLLATVMAHKSYEIVSESVVAGRATPTTRVGVTMVLADRTVPDVSFIAARTADGRWMVQQVDTERITRR